MRWGLVLAIAKKELTETLRDRRSLLMLLVLPTLIYPVMLIGLTKVATNQAESREARGHEHVQELLARLRGAGLEVRLVTA